MFRILKKIIFNLIYANFLTYDYPFMQQNYVQFRSYLLLSSDNLQVLVQMHRWYMAYCFKTKSEVYRRQFSN